MFYGLKVEIEKKGKYAKREFVPLEYDWDSKHSQGMISKFELPDYEPVFSDLVLTKGSVLTDFVEDGGAISSYGFIVSEKVKKILSDFKIVPHKFYPLRLVSTKHNLATEGHYFWMQVLIIDNYNWVDFNRSKFIIKKNLNDSIRNIDIQTKENLVDATERYKGFKEKLSFSEIKLNDEYKKSSYDLFFLWKIVAPAIISKNLKERLEQENVTGLEEFKELKILI